MTYLLLRKFWFAIPIALLLAGLLITRGTLADVKQERDKARADYAGEQARHAVTRQSVDGLTKALTEQNLAVQRTASDAALRQKAGQDALRATQSANKALEGQIDRLKASASRKPVSGAPCEVSEALRSAEGL